MTIAPMTAQDMNAAAEIPAMPFMRPEDEELETLRSDICGTMYDMFDGIAPLHSLLRFVANTRVVSPRTEEGILRMVNAVTTTRMEAGECLYHEDDGLFNSFADEMRSCVSRIAVPLAFNLYANKSAKERVCQFMDSFRNNFGLFGQDVLEIWCRRMGINIPQTYEGQVSVLERMVEDGFKPFMQCIEFACLDMNESFGIF
jgi:hypothetical protein